MSTIEHVGVRLLTIDEVAVRLRLSRSAVRRRIWQGELPVVRLGNGPAAPVRVDEHELDRYIESARVCLRTGDPRQITSAAGPGRETRAVEPAGAGGGTTMRGDHL